VRGAESRLEIHWPPCLRQEGGSGTAQAQRRRDHASDSWRDFEDSAPDLLLENV
jgi:hypothetical protein